MRRFAANLSILFPTVPYMDRFSTAARAGFDLIETWWPADAFAAGASSDDIVGAAKGLGLETVLLNFPAGDMKAGDRGLAGDPERAGEFREYVPAALELARRLGARKLNALAGNALSDADRPRQLDLLVESVGFAADAAAEAGMEIMLELLNAAETPRYLLQHTSTVLDVIERVGRPNVKMQFDVYHVAMAGEDMFESIRRVGDRIGHVQLADMPGRHEPGTGSLPFPEILDALEAAGYHDVFALEFVPADPAAPDFSSVERLGGTLGAKV